MYLHGYIVLKFEHAEEVKYCRIDWGTDGVYHEIGDKEDELLEYVGGLEKKIEAGIFSRVVLLGGFVMSYSAFVANLSSMVAKNAKLGVVVGITTAVCTGIRKI